MKLDDPCTLVTGAAGYIGSHVLLDLVSEGRPVVALDDLSTGVRDRVFGGVPFIEGSVADDALLDQVIGDYGVDSIIHFAGSLIAPESLTKPIAYYQNNTAASLKLLAAAVRGKVRNFVFSSSAAVYGPALGALGEDALTGPSTPYGWSKLMTERMLADVATAHGMNWLALRYFNVAGAEPSGRLAPNPGATHLIAVACEAALGRRAFVPVYGNDYDTPDGTCIRDYIHVSDLARIHTLGLESLKAGGASRILNCGYGRGVSVLEVIRTLGDVIGRDVPYNMEPRRLGDLSFVVADSSALRSGLGWCPSQDDLATILSSAYAAASTPRP